jgi:hypothetical protein
VTRILDYLRRNALAALAFACSLLALGGASYAAFSLPAGSVGTRQLRTGAVTNRKLANGSITPAKLDSRTIGGSVRHWASSTSTAGLSAAAAELRPLPQRNLDSPTT